MEQEPFREFRVKKRIEPTVREMNTSLLILRALQVGIRIPDLNYIEVGEVFDILTESGNDSFEYPKKGTEGDFKAIFGGK